LAKLDMPVIRHATYIAAMPDGTLERSYGKVFDEVAEEYDRHRPTYPDALLDHACDLAALGAGDRVLEIGCGTGQLTRGLLAQGLRVSAIEPGDRLIALARQNLRDIGDVEFVNARLEDAPLPRERFHAVFSGSAMHWIDPDLGWHKAFEALVPGGTLALIQYFGCKEQRSADDQQALLSAIAKIAPELAASWPSYRELEAMLAGVHERRGNVSGVWAWLGSYEVARDYAARLFDDAQIAAVPRLIERTADEVNALLGTMSFSSRLSPEQREAVEHEIRTLYKRLGRPIRSSIVACAVTARRAV
jgi:ubiquinone/menaquinone biosynthesis C-methylase UbiE